MKVLWLAACAVWCLTLTPIATAQQLELGGARIEKRNADGLTEAEVAYNEGAARQAAGDTDGAIAAYTRALELDPHYPDARNNRAQARLDKGDAKGAVEDFTEAISYRPNSPDGYYNRGNAYLDLSKHDEAITDYTKAIELGKADSNTYNNRANAYRGLKKYKEAIADYTKAIEGASAAYYFQNRAITHEESGAMALALSDYTRAIELAPEFADAYAGRGTLLLRAGKDAEADRDFAVAFRLDPAQRTRLENYIREMRAARPRKR